MLRAMRTGKLIWTGRSPVHIDVAPRRKRGVSLTPLIDVVFNLLLFFMLASSLTRWSGLELATGSERADANDTPPAEVRLLETGQWRYGGEALELSALSERLGRELEAGAISSVILRAQDEVRLDALIRGFDQLNHAGITALALGESGD